MADAMIKTIKEIEADGGNVADMSMWKIYEKALNNIIKVDGGVTRQMAESGLVTNGVSAEAASEISDVFAKANIGIAIDGMKYTIQIDGQERVVVVNDGETVLDAVKRVINGSSLSDALKSAMLESIEAKANMGYEVAFSVGKDGKVQYRTKETSMVFDADGRNFVYRSVQDFDQDTLFIVHSHPTMSRNFEADIANKETLGGAGSLVILPGGEVNMLFAPERIPAAASIEGFTGTLAYTQNITRGNLVESVDAKVVKEAVIDVMGPAADRLLRILAASPEIKAEDLEKLTVDINALQAGNSGASSLSVAENIARLLRTAGVYTSDLGVVIDCRAGGYDYKAVTAAIKTATTKDSPIKYFILVDESVADRAEGVITVTAGELDQAMKAAKVESQNTAYAVMEDKAGMEMMKNHYRQTGDKEKKSSFLVSGKDSVKGKDGEIPSATLMVELIRLADRVASQDSPTAVAIGCAKSTIKELETVRTMLGGFLRIIKKLNIGEVISGFLSAMRATSVSV